MKYAVVKTGGKQYKVEEGRTIKTERLNIEKNKPVGFDEVLLFVDDNKIDVGRPRANAKVMGKVIDHTRTKKISTFRYKAKTRYHKKTGHRQEQTEILIEKIEGGSSLDSTQNKPAKKG